MFQAMMDDIFEDLIEEEIVIIYMDDMFLSAKTKEQLRENTKRVLQRLMENDLYLKPKKCEFCKEKIEWLGIVIQEGKITMDPGKLKGIQDWPAPTTVKQVRASLDSGISIDTSSGAFLRSPDPLTNSWRKTENSNGQPNVNKCSMI